MIIYNIKNEIFKIYIIYDIYYILNILYNVIYYNDIKHINMLIYNIISDEPLFHPCSATVNKCTLNYVFLMLLKT